jgi:hypothetical protein
MMEQNMKQPSKAMMVFMSIPWLDIIQTILAILRLTDVITWSWWIVLLPLWVFDVFYIVSTIIILILENIKRNQPIEQQNQDQNAPQLTPEMINLMEQVKQNRGNMTPIDLGDNINGNTEDNMGGFSERSEQSE